jgi:hypothetical protein
MPRGPYLLGLSPTGGVLVASVVCGGPAVSDALHGLWQTDHSRRHGQLKRHRLYVCAGSKAPLRGAFFHAPWDGRPLHPK